MARAARPDSSPVVWTHCSVYKGTVISPLAKSLSRQLSGGIKGVVFAWNAYLVPVPALRSLGAGVLCPGTWSEAALLPSPGIQAEQSAAERAFHGRAVERDKRSTKMARAACPDHCRGP